MARTSLRRLWTAVGPGLVAGAADVDPTTVATMSVIGATTVYALSWLTLLIFPVLVFIQMVSSRIAVVTQDGLMHVVDRRYGRFWQLLLLASIVSVTVITIAADLEAGAAAIGLLTHALWQWFVLPLGVVVVGWLLVGTYDEIQRVLKYVLLVLLAYVLAALLVRPDWGMVLRQTVLPPIHLDKAYMLGVLALLGTSLTNYVYVWQTIEIATQRPKLSWLRPKQADAVSGMLFAVLIFWFILVATASSLGLHHEQVQTAQDAARALQPVAGPFASYIFGIGLLGSSLLALPVLLGTVAYSVGAQFDFARGFQLRWRDAPLFYAIIAGSVLLGVVVSLVGVSPIQLLLVASVAGGLSTPIGLSFLFLIAGDRRVMGDYAGRGWVKVVGWVITGAVSAISLVYLFLQFAS